MSDTSLNLEQRLLLRINRPCYIESGFITRGGRLADNLLLRPTLHLTVDDNMTGKCDITGDNSGMIIANDLKDQRIIHTPLIGHSVMSCFLVLDSIRHGPSHVNLFYW